MDSSRRSLLVARPASPVARRRSHRIAAYSPSHLRPIPFNPLSQSPRSFVSSPSSSPSFSAGLIDSPTVLALHRNVNREDHRMRAEASNSALSGQQGERTEISAPPEDGEIADSAPTTDGGDPFGPVTAMASLPPPIPTALNPGAEASLHPLLTDNQELQVPLNEKFLLSCRFYSHDPRRPSPSSLDLLFKLGNYFGKGITKPELRQIIRKCKQCRNHMYTENRVFHACGTATALDVRSPVFHMVTAFLTTVQHRGFTQDDMLYLLRECKACHKICLNRSVYYHSCVQLTSN
ncbi:hypothetical protein FA13DRAFT_1797902 [Coprinellus micaceus]|uniref:Uncharacterized protein n=1 Tax=Coprinellus micaceus TaxID=71717 RepID=A0A4Y7SP80_COPMI|nr:hypothetical protein FA13DRAFT_1797902 [Coprinellus micaceus]